MVTLNSADNALKSFYLDAVTESLNMKINPFLAKIKHSTAKVTGKDVKQLVRLGFNGGISAGTETGDLPEAADGDYVQFTGTLKNLYGKVEISDKAIRASANNEGAFVNLLNDQMESLVKSASVNFGRMLFGDGSGFLSNVVAVDGENVLVDNAQNFIEGMYVEFRKNGAVISGLERQKITVVDRDNGAICVAKASSVPVGATAYIVGSYGNEITGLGAIFSDKALYGQDRTKGFMKPYMNTEVGDITEEAIQMAIDKIEEISGGKVNFIICSWGVRRALMALLKANGVMMSTTQLEGGFTAISYNGIPVVVDRFCPEGTMYLLNTDDFTLHQLCDWEWLEAEDGKILKQVPGKPVYTATLVKYAELMCERPMGQGMLGGISEA